MLFYSSSNHVDEYRDLDFDVIITVCDHAKENCPYLPSRAKRVHQNFPDPAKATGTETKVMNEFRSVRDLIRHYSREFIAGLV